MGFLSRGFTLKTDGTFPGTQVYDADGKLLGNIIKLQFNFDLSSTAFMPPVHIEFSKMVKPSGYLHSECAGCEVKDQCINWEVSAVYECHRCNRKEVVDEVNGVSWYLDELGERDENGEYADIPCCMFTTDREDYLCGGCQNELDDY